MASHLLQGLQHNLSVGLERGELLVVEVTSVWHDGHEVEANVVVRLPAKVSVKSSQSCSARHGRNDTTQ